MKAAVMFLIILSFMSSMFAPFQQEQAQSHETSKSKVWFLGTLTFNNTERSIRDVNFTVGTKNFEEVQIPKEATFYRVDADIGIEPSFGPKPLRIVRIRWEPDGTGVTGGGDRLYLYFPAFGINKSIPFLPWDKPGSLAFHMEDDEMEKTFKFGIRISIGGLFTGENLWEYPPYTITVIRVNESATNATANPTNSSCEWAGDSLAYYETNPSYLQIEQESNETFCKKIQRYINLSPSYQFVVILFPVPPLHLIPFMILDAEEELKNYSTQYSSMLCI